MFVVIYSNAHIKKHSKKLAPSDRDWALNCRRSSNALFPPIQIDVALQPPIHLSIYLPLLPIIPSFNASRSFPVHNHASLGLSLRPVNVVNAACSSESVAVARGGCRRFRDGVDRMGGHSSGRRDLE